MTGKVPALAVGTAGAGAAVGAVAAAAVAAIVIVGNTAVAAAGCTLSDLHLYIPARVVVVAAAAGAREWSTVAQRAQKEKKIRH